MSVFLHLAGDLNEWEGNGDGGWGNNEHHRLIPFEDDVGPGFGSIRAAVKTIFEAHSWLQTSGHHGPQHFRSSHFKTLKNV